MNRPTGESPRQPKWAREPTPEEAAKIEHLLDTGQFTLDDARRRVQGPPQTEPKPVKPKVRSGRRRSGYVRDFSGRADEYRGGPGPAAPGHKEIYARGIADAKRVLAEGRLSHPSDTKTESVLNALDQIRLARIAGGAYKIFAKDDDDPRRQKLGRYRDGDHASALKESHRSAALESMKVACGACALTCFMKDRPDSFHDSFKTPEARKRLRQNITEATENGRDFDCSVAAKSPKK